MAIANDWKRNDSAENTRQRSDNFGLITAAAIAGGFVGAALLAQKAIRASRTIDLKDRVALVTGGSRGLGLLIAQRLAKAGAWVAICARDAEELERAVQLIPGDHIFAQPCDITDTGEVEDLIANVTLRFGRPIDILVNNAGVIQVGPMETMTPSDYEEAMRTHFWGPFHAIRAVLPAMRARKIGRIVNVASIGGKVSVPHLLPYSASKFALVGFSEGLRAELAKSGVYVTTVCPGLIRTGSPRNAFFKGRHRSEYAWFALGDSLPGISQSADACADEILEALRHGDAEIITSPAGKFAALIHGVLPGFVSDALGIVNTLLPGAEGPGSIGAERRLGHESESPLAPSPLTLLTQRAELANNEVA